MNKNLFLQNLIIALNKAIGEFSFRFIQKYCIALTIFNWLDDTKNKLLDFSSSVPPSLKDGNDYTLIFQCNNRWNIIISSDNEEVQNGLTDLFNKNYKLNGIEPNVICLSKFRNDTPEDMINRIISIVLK